MQKRLAMLAMAVFLLPLVPGSAHSQEKAFTVMSRNLYLGADVGIAMELLPDFPAATQFMWDQMRETDFPTRSKLFVKEIKSENPDVIGLQEATKWYCTAGILSDEVVIYDFVEILLADLASQNLYYEIASKDGKVAQNTGFEIAPIPMLTKATDPGIFPSIFNQESAYCGFEIGDVLLIKSEYSKNLLNVGTSEYKEKYTIIPTIMSIYRGYSWADLSIDEKPIRFVTTHLESIFDEKGIPVAKIQAEQLVNDLSETKIPIVLMGDFNSDPRDPRGSNQPNPGEQPSQNELCQAQVETPTLETAKDSCNSFWTIAKAGFKSTGPEELDAENFTWGLDALLTGADPRRQEFAKEMGNEVGFTDRLDYIFLRGQIDVVSAKLVGNNQNAPWASDHAGIVATLSIEQPINYDEKVLAGNERFPIGIWNSVFAFMVSLLFLLGIKRIFD